MDVQPQLGVNLAGLLAAQLESDEVYSKVVWVQIACSILSIVLTAAVNWIYWSSKRLRADHASTLINIITLADAAYTLKFFVGSVAWAFGHREERSSFHLIADNCRSSAAYGQFTGIASIGWNAAWMYDLITALRNPLVNTAALRRWYHLGVWTLAIATTIPVLVSELHATADDHTCRPQATSPEGLVFILPLLLTMGLGLVSLSYAFMRLSGSSRRRNAEISTIRRKLRNRHAGYVAVFILLWAWPLAHDWVDPEDQVASLTVLDAVAVSGQAAIFAAIRLSEPGAAAMFAALCRRVYRTLFVYPCARCTRGRQAADRDADFDRAALVAALERGVSEYEATSKNGGKRETGAGYAEIGEDGLPSSGRYEGMGSAQQQAQAGRTRPSQIISRSHSGLGLMPGWMRRSMQRGSLDRADSDERLLSSGLVAAGKRMGAPGVVVRTPTDAGQREKAAQMLGAAIRKASIDGYDEEAGHNPHSPYRDAHDSGEGDGEGSSLSALRSMVAADDDGGGLASGLGSNSGNNSSSSGRRGLLGGLFGFGSSASSSPAVGAGGGSDRAAPLLENDHGWRPDTRRQSAGSAGRGPSSSPTHSGSRPLSAASGNLGLPQQPASAVGRQTSFAVAEARALGSGWDVASAAGLRMELGCTMLTALCEAVAAGDARARGGREASVYAFPRGRRRTASSTSSGGDSRSRGDSRGRLDSHGGLDTSRSRASDVDPLHGILENDDGEDDDEFGGSGQVLSNPAAPDEKRSVASWIRDPSTVHLSVCVRHPLTTAAIQRAAAAQATPVTPGGPGSSSSSSTPAAAATGQSPGRASASGYDDDEDEDDEDLVDVRASSFADADFAYIRRAAALPPGEVSRTFNPMLLRTGRLKAHFSDGASSSFFCSSADHALVLKTVTAAEVEMLLRLLPAYARHLADNPDSLLVRFYGCFSVTLNASTWGGMFGSNSSSSAGAGAGAAAAGAGGPASGQAGPTRPSGPSGGSRVYFILMSSVFPVLASLQPKAPATGEEARDNDVHRPLGPMGGGATAASILAHAVGGSGPVVFDLKGSTINRRARPAKENLATLNNASAAAAAGAKNGPSAVLPGSGGKGVVVGPSSSSAGADPSGQEGQPTPLPSKTPLLLDLDLRDSFPRGLPLSDSRLLFGDSVAAIATGVDLPAGRNRAAAVLDQLRRDVTLLASQGLMDYSLLVQLVPIGNGQPSAGSGGVDGAGMGMGSSRGFSSGPGAMPHGHGHSHVHGSNNGIEVLGGVIRVSADSELTPGQAAQVLGSTSNPPRRPAVAPLVPASGAGGLGQPFAAQGPQLLLPVLSKPGSATAQGISITRWSSLAVSACGVGVDVTDTSPPANGNAAAALYPARAIIQLGIVDVLQFFDTTKKLENAFKNLRYGSLTGDADVSAVDPHRYAVRFTDFLARVLGQDL